MRGFDVTSRRLAVFLAVTLGMLMPTGMAFAQG